MLGTFFYGRVLVYLFQEKVMNSRDILSAARYFMEKYSTNCGWKSGKPKGGRATEKDSAMVDVKDAKSLPPIIPMTVNSAPVSPITVEKYEKKDSPVAKIQEIFPVVSTPSERERKQDDVCDMVCHFVMF